MSNAKHDEEVIRAAEALEFAVQTSLEAANGNEVALLCLMLELDPDKVASTEQEAIRERIKWAWNNLRHALEVRKEGWHLHDVVDLQVIESRKEGNGEHLALMAGGDRCDIENAEVFKPLDLKLGDTIQVRRK